MKLKDLLSEIYTKYDIINDSDDEILYGSNLSEFEGSLLLCDEFKECDSLEFLPLPNVKDRNGKVWIAMTISLSDKYSIKFKGKCYLLSLKLTSNWRLDESFNINTKKEAFVTPVLLDSKNFTPLKKIVLPIPIDEMTDLEKENTKSTLNNILEHPHDYEIEDKSVVIRGLFEQVINPENIQSCSESIDIDLKKDSPYEVVYISRKMSEVEENLIETTICKGLINRNLKDKFIDKFGISIINEEDYFKFIEEN